MGKEFAGRLVYLTMHADVWFRELNPKFNIPMVNRIAKVVKVFDWETDEGRLLLAEREKTGKWGKLNPKAFKFVLKIYCPELKIKDKVGFATDEILPRMYPGTELTMFELLPPWMLQSLQKEEIDIFKVLRKDSDTNDKPEIRLDTKTKSDVKKDVSRPIRKKSK
jgi:hypothetical protein